MKIGAGPGTACDRLSHYIVDRHEIAPGISLLETETKLVGA